MISLVFGPEAKSAEVETPILWPPHAKSWLTGKDLDAGRDWGLEEKGTTEDEMAGWHHRLNGYEFEWTPGVTGLACCDSWGRKESDMTEWLNWTELNCTSGLSVSPPISINFFFKPRANDYTTKQLILLMDMVFLKLCTSDYIPTMYPALGHISPS